MQYLQSQNLYLGKYHIFTEDEIMEYDALWVDWKRSLPKLRHSNLLHVFPEARKLMKQTAKQELKVLNRNLDLYQDAETRVADMISKIPLYERETWFGLTEVFISEKIE